MKAHTTIEKRMVLAAASAVVAILTLASPGYADCNPGGAATGTTTCENGLRCNCTYHGWACVEDDTCHHNDKPESQALRSFKAPKNQTTVREARTHQIRPLGSGGPGDTSGQSGGGYAAGTDAQQKRY